METPNSTCANYTACPVFNGILEGKEITSKSYRSRYCNAGKEGWESCKRYQVKQASGKCPPTLLPNSAKTIEEIIAVMNMN
jgi:hypothetical protein